MPKPENIAGQGFHTNPERINKKGRPVSIKNELKDILGSDGELPIEKKLLVRETEDNYYFKIPTQQKAALKLVSIAMGKSSNNLRALITLLETFDGKATQTIDTNIIDERPIIEVKSDKTKNSIENL